MTTKPPHDRDMVCVGQIATAHGVRGLVRLRSFTADPEAIADYNPLRDLTGRRTFVLTLVGEAKDQLLARIAGVEDRESALALRGLRLYVPRESLPAPEDQDEFYHVDLVGLAVVTVDGVPFGTVVAVNDFGAGDVVEIARGAEDEPSNTVTVPFTRACVPVVDLDGRRMVVDPPLGLLDDAPLDADIPDDDGAADLAVDDDLAVEEDDRSDHVNGKQVLG